MSYEATPADWWVRHPAELSEALGRQRKSSGRSMAEERLTMTVEEAAQALGVSRALAYEAVRAGQIPSIKIGRRVLVPRSQLTDLLRPKE